MTTIQVNSCEITKPLKPKCNYDIQTKFNIKKIDTEE